MATEKQDRKLEMDLVALLARSFPGMTVEARHSKRWDRMCLTFRWSGFAGLLPEERFQRLLGVISESFRDERLSGCVWLELAQGETIDQFLKMPRSEDVADREQAIFADLQERGFFDALRQAMKPTPTKACKGDFSRTGGALSKGRSADKVTQDAKLLFIRHGAYCDCQVLGEVEPALSKLSVGAA
ncbi:MAG: hypothetical protein IIC02_12975 [Planctomycetes bacterium]|nr:hypothetical protein [Planctomycetota bacterium]